MSTNGDEDKTVEVQAPEGATAELQAPEGTTAKSSDFDTLRKRNLSTLSRQYDIDGDGELDSVEMAMRDMDQEGLGHLSNEKVYKIMRDQIEANHKLFGMKRVVIALCCLVVLLAVSNLGTAWAAFYLAKDTDVDESGTMHVKGTDKNVAVASAQQFFDLKPDASQRHMVAADCTGDGVVDTGCYSLKGLASGKITQADVNAIYQNVKNSVIVKIQVPNKCVSSLTDTLTVYQPAGQYITGFKSTGVVNFLQTNPTSSAKPYFKFDCASSTSTNPYCVFTYDTGLSAEICGCSTFSEFEESGSCTAGEGTKCGIDTCFNTLTNAYQQKTTSIGCDCTCTGGYWECSQEMTCIFC